MWKHSYGPHFPSAICSGGTLKNAFMSRISSHEQRLIWLFQLEDMLAFEEAVTYAD